MRQQSTRAALIGCGRIAPMHVSAITRAGGEIVAVCDSDEQKAGQVAALSPGAGVYTDVGVLLSEARPQVVHILTPPATHAALAIRAAEAGCHVLVEKPMALDTQEAGAMIAAAQEHGVTLTPNHNYLYKPSVLKARDLVERGEIGEVVFVDAYYGLSDEANQYGGDGGAHWAYRLPGGVFSNFLPHLIYLQAAFIGGIEGVGGVSVGGDPNSDEPESELTVLLQSAAATGVMAISMRARPYAKFVRIYGTKGIVHADLVGEITTVHRNRRLPRLLTKALFNLETVPQLAMGTTVNSLKVASGSMPNMPDLHNFVQALYASIQAGDAPPASAEDGGMVVRVMEQIRERTPSRPAPPAAPAAEQRGPRTAVESQVLEGGALQGKKALVTGGAGYLGRRVAHALARCGADVRVLVRDPSRVPGDLERRAEVVTGNVADTQSVRAAMKGVDLVVHCAAVTTNNVPWSLHQQTNIDGTQVVIEEARAAGVARLVHVSSVIVYGLEPNVSNGAVSESAPYPEQVDRWSYYLRSKLDADRMALEAATTGETEFTVVRPGILYGPGAEGPVERGLVQLGSVRLTIGRGQNVMPFTYVDNAVDGILLALTAPETGGQAYNLVDEPQIDVRSVSRRAATVRGQPTRLVPVPAPLLSSVAQYLETRTAKAGSEAPPRLSRFQIASATRDVRYDTTKARRELGWEPAVSLEEGLRRTFDKDG